MTSEPEKEDICDISILKEPAPFGTLVTVVLILLPPKSTLIVAALLIKCPLKLSLEYDCTL